MGMVRDSLCKTATEKPGSTLLLLRTLLLLLVPLVGGIQYSAYRLQVDEACPDLVWGGDRGGRGLR